VSLPYWRTQRRGTIGAPPTDDPFALTHVTSGGARLFALNAVAEARGLYWGQALADAKAMEPALAVDEATSEADARALTRLARWCGRWSPLTAADPQAPGGGPAHWDGVLIDATGCAHLFGGEAQMLLAVLHALKSLGLTAFAAAAPTIGLAWGLARFAAPLQKEQFVRTKSIEPALSTLPVAALRVGEGAQIARRFGLKRVGDLAPHGGAALARRFGLAFVRRLDQARGAAGEPFVALQPETSHRAAVDLAEPILTQEGVLIAADRALATLCAGLSRAGAGARRIVLQLYRVDGRALRLGVGLAAPGRDAAHILRLLKERLERAAIDAGFGFDRVELLAHPVEPMKARQRDFAGKATDAGRVSDLLALRDVVSARLGTEAARFAARRESYAPERASGWAAAPLSAEADGAARPLLILPRPEPAEVLAEVPDGPPRRFRWRRVSHRVAAAEGPERISPEWWRKDASSRDYFRIETAEGRRFWLYREGVQGREGLKDRDGAAPRWFVHGLL